MLQYIPKLLFPQVMPLLTQRQAHLLWSFTADRIPQVHNLLTDTDRHTNQRQ